MTSMKFNKESSEAGSVDCDLKSTLKSVFGFDSFRPHQEEIVRALIAGRDLFAVMPTGGGKSLCYQLPARLMSGCCLVISPLISLMKDQVDAAQAIGLRAAYLNSSQSGPERGEVRQALQAGEVHLLYVSPERFAMPAFTTLLQSVPLAFVAIDEAHCISEWGHDFRPDYLQLAEIVRLFPDSPVAAFTATATQRVERDIIAKLGLRRPFRVRASFNRPNLFYRVLPKTDPNRQLFEFVRKQIAKQQGVPPFVIFSDRTLREMSARMPGDSRELLAISGIGEHKLKKYGDAFVSAIRSFRQEHPEVEPLVQDEFYVPQTSRALGDTTMETADLLAKGMGIEAVATERGLKPGTIITHIERLVESGHPVNIAPLIDNTKLEMVAEVLRHRESAAIGPVVEQFNGRISYEEARLARAWLTAQARQNG